MRQQGLVCNNLCQAIARKGAKPRRAVRQLQGPALWQAGRVCILLHPCILLVEHHVLMVCVMPHRVF